MDGRLSERPSRQAPQVGSIGEEIKGMRTISFALAAPTMTLNELRHMHFQAYRQHQTALAWEIKVATMGQRPIVPFSRALVKITRLSVGTPDHDGLIGGMKCLIDCFLPTSKRHPRGIGFILDDKPSCMMLEVVGIRVAHRAEQRTTVEISELP